MASRVLKLLQDNTTLNNNLKSMVFKPDTNTITFLNPTPQRGDVNSIKFIKTIVPGDISGTFPVFMGQSQPVSVYCITYYSSNPSNNSTVELVSGSMFVPQTITKSKVIEWTRGASIGTDDVASVPWIKVNDPSWTSATPVQRATSYRVTPLICWASLGYVVIAADGFGLGVSLNKTDLFSNYFSNVNPSVDVIRAFKKYLDYTISTGSTQFQGQLSTPKLNIIHTGYSLGSLAGPGIINELKEGVSQSIPSSETSLINSVKGIYSVGLDAKVAFDYWYANRATAATRFINPTIVNLSLQVVASNYNVYQFATIGCKSNVLPSFLEDLNRNGTETVFGSTNFTGVFSKIFYDYTANAVEYATAGIQAPTIIGGLPFVDWKQLYTEEGMRLLSSVLTNAIPWTSKMRNLRDLSNTPIAHIYGHADELVCPLGPGVLDAATNLDQSNMGPDQVGTLGLDGNPLWVFRGANKVCSKVNVTGGDILTNPTSGTEAQMVNQIATMANNQFINYKVTSTAYGTTLSSHSGFGTVYSAYTHLVLAQHP